MHLVSESLALLLKIGEKVGLCRPPFLRDAHLQERLVVVRAFIE
jgi:hypothetical protein